MLYETLLARLADEAPALVVSEAPTVGAAPASAAERSREARREGADAWLWVGVGAGAGTLVLRVQTFDILAGGDPRERTFEKPRRDRNEDSLWDEVIGEALSGFAQAAPRGDVREAEVLVRAAPGTRIGGLPGGEIVMGVSGEATVRLAAFATYTLTATHPRFRPFAKSFYLRETPLVVECEQASIGPWALELGLDKLAYPSFRLTWFGVPDRLFVSFGWTSFTVGIPLWGDEAGTDLPLNQIGASVGIYLGRPTSLFRPYAGAEAFIRLLNNGSGDWLGIGSRAAHAWASACRRGWRRAAIRWSGRSSSTTRAPTCSPIPGESSCTTRPSTSTVKRSPGTCTSGRCWRTCSTSRRG